MELSDKPAFLFPGQGVQHVGMSDDIFEDKKTRILFNQADYFLNFDLSQLLRSGPPEKLEATRNAQPAIFVDGFARYQLLNRRGIRPSLVLGHSLGEFTGLAAAGCLSFEDGLRLVSRRGELMDEVDSNGSMMAVIGLNYEEVEQIVSRIDNELTVANYNSPMQVVLSGRNKILNKAKRVVKDRGGKPIKLDVSGPFHSPQMKDAETKLSKTLDDMEFSDPEVPFISSVSAQPEHSGKRLKSLLRTQMSNSVNWIAYVKTLSNLEIDTTVEVGPDATLKKLTDRTDPSLTNKTFHEVI